MSGFEPKRHEEAIFDENIQTIKANFGTETEMYNTLISTKVEKFTERDNSEFKSFLFSFLQENRKVIDDFILKKYESKAQSFDNHV